MNENDRRERLLSWLETIKAQAQEIALSHHIFVETRNLIAANKKLSETGSEFFRWMKNNYVIAQAVAVRRQVDADRRAISLKRLLLELQNFPQLASRCYFISLYTNTPRDLAEHTYDRLVGRGRNSLDPDQVAAEIAELDSRTQLIKNLVDRKFAHSDRRGTGALPRFTDLEHCIELLEELVKRYVLLLRATSLAGLLPAFTYDWKSIFRFPWLEGQEPLGE